MPQPSPDPNAVDIGALRWPVTIYARKQVPDVASAGLTETLVNPVLRRADVQPIGPMTFYAAAQVDTPITHKITFRWIDGLDTTYVILRATNRPDATVRNEQFRIRRVMDVDGRKRFTRCECELEKTF